MFSLNLEIGNFDLRRLKFVLHHLAYHYGAEFAQRQKRLLLQLSAMQPVDRRTRNRLAIPTSMSSSSRSEALSCMAGP